MKNLIVAIAFATFSLTLPLVMAQQAVEADSATNVNTEVETSVAAKVEKEGKRIVIDINTNEDEIHDAVETVAELFGERLGAELRAELTTELEKLDDDDRAELKLKLKEMFGGDGIHIGGGSGRGLGFPEFLVAMTAIIFTLGLPVIILVLVLTFSNRKRKQKMQLISSYIEANQPVPAHVMAEFGSDSKSNSSFRSGLTLTFVGIAIAVFLGAVDDWDTAALGLIPIAIGVARLISWKYGDKHDSESSTV